MRKLLTLLSVFCILTVSEAAFAEVGYVDYAYISKNYPLAQKYNSVIQNKVQAIKTYAQQKDAQVAKAATQAEKDKIKQEGIQQVQLKQREVKALKEQYENELVAKVRTASERVRVAKKLDMIIKADARVTGGINCTMDVLNVLKTQTPSVK